MAVLGRTTSFRWSVATALILSICTMLQEEESEQPPAAAARNRTEASAIRQIWRPPAERSVIRKSGLAPSGWYPKLSV